MDNFGLLIRNLREQRNLPLREVSAALDIDQAIISKLERMQRRATLEQVQKFAAFYQVPLDDLITHWLSDEIANILSKSEIALQALDMAREKVIKIASESYDRETVFQQLYNMFRKTEYNKAWVFGDYAGGQNVFARNLSVLTELSPVQVHPKDSQVKALEQKIEKLTKLKTTIFVKEKNDKIAHDISENNLIQIWDKAWGQ